MTVRRTPEERLRAAIDVWRTAEARARIAAWRGEAAADAEVVAAHGWLGSDEAAELLDAVDDPSPATRGALAVHIARFRAEECLVDARRALSRASVTALDVGGERRMPSEVFAELSRGVEPSRAAIIERAFREGTASLGDFVSDARREADAHGAAVLSAQARHADAGPEGVDFVRESSTWLAATEDPYRELLDWAWRRCSVDPALGAWGLPRLLAFPALGDMFPRRDRLRRVGRIAEPLGLGRELSARVRVEPPWSRIDPRPRVVAESPLDVRVSPGGSATNVVAELAAAEIVGRALGHALTLPVLPAEVRHAALATVPRALGIAFASLWLEPAFLAGAFGGTRREREDARRCLALVLLLDHRLAAAAASLRARRVASLREHLALAAELASLAIGRSVEPQLARWLIGTASGGITRFRARRGAHAVAVALRERFDVDWYRNPRAGIAIRSAAERGGTLSVESWVEELGGTVDLALDRIAELIA